MIEEYVIHTIRCQNCGSQGPFKIKMYFIVNHATTYCFRNSSLVWGRDSEIACGCGKHGTVADFLMDYHQLIPHHQQIKGLEERVDDLQTCLAQIVGQFAYADIDGRLHSGGVPSLQRAFEILGLHDPFRPSDLEQYISKS